MVYSSYENTKTAIAPFINNFAMINVINRIKYHTVSAVYHLAKQAFFFLHLLIYVNMWIIS